MSAHSMRPVMNEPWMRPTPWPIHTTPTTSASTRMTRRTRTRPSVRSRRMHERVPLFMVLLAAVLWGTTGTARALAPAEASPLSVGAVRIAIGGTALVLVALGRGTLGGTSWARLPAFTAVCAVALYQVAFFEGVARAGVAAGTLVAIGSAPVFAGIAAWLALRERPTVRWAAATLVGIAGLALLSLPRAGVTLDPVATGLPLVAGGSYAAYATASKSLLREHDSVAVAALAFGGGGLLLTPVLVLSDLSWVTQPAGITVALELGLVATALAYILFTAALARLPVAWGATGSL